MIQFFTFHKDIIHFSTLFSGLPCGSGWRGPQVLVTGGLLWWHERHDPQGDFAETKDREIEVRSGLPS